MVNHQNTPYSCKQAASRQVVPGRLQAESVCESFHGVHSAGPGPGLRGARGPAVCSSKCQRLIEMRAVRSTMGQNGVRQACRVDLFAEARPMVPGARPRACAAPAKHRGCGRHKGGPGRVRRVRRESALWSSSVKQCMPLSAAARGGPLSCWVPGTAHGSTQAQGARARRVPPRCRCYCCCCRRCCAASVSCARV